ncbi:MAG: chorismate synthase [Saprospiraceae bacterium]|nr:chorismate synthase [Saprospiraceae bacterium]
MNSYGKNFRIQIYGESHGPAIGVIIDGLPPGIPIDASDFSEDITRRKPGKLGTTNRVESDVPMFFSGVFDGKTTGAPLHISFENKDVRSGDYLQQLDFPRPGHADFVALKKFKGFHDYRGGGHFSGRMTVALVAAGVLAKKLIHPIQISANLIEAGGSTDIESSVEAALKNQDSIGGIIECVVTGVPVGLGEPFFDSIESKISQLVFSIPAVKGIEFGSGFKAARMTGSQHNDMLLDLEGKTKTNHSGGINGGISNGNPIIFRLAVKPTNSISRSQESINVQSGQVEKFTISGRHDACIALRVPVVAEAVAALVLADFILEMKMG